MKKLTIPVQASFKKEVAVNELEKINLFFGYNGSGKTTISRVLRNEANAFVYNEDFIEDNFRNSDKQKGVFSIGKDAGDAQEKIAQAVSKKKQFNETLDKLQGNEEARIKGLLSEKKKAQSTNWETIVNKLWSIKTNTENIKIKDCIPGLRGNKEKLASAFVQYYNNEKREAVSPEKFESTWRDLIKRGDIIFNKALEKKVPLRIKNIKYFDRIIEDKIWNKKIIGNQDSILNELYEQLKNSNWVNQGRQFLNEQGLCPFCQQPLKEQFLVDLKDYFNESFENDKALLLQLQQQFNYETFIANLRQMLEEEYSSETQLELKILELEQIFKDNNTLISLKISKPSESVNLNEVRDCLVNIAKEVGVINKLIIRFNQQIDEREKTEKKLNKDFWDYYTSYYSNEIVDFITQKEKLITEISDIEKNIIELKNQIAEENKIITENQNKLTDVQTSINSINNSLAKNGFTSFKVKKTNDDFCRIVRLERGQELNIYKTLSEGEKTIISFLYFVELCKGTTDKTKEIDGNRIIVIDDPISSLSQNIVFEVAQIIRKEFLTPQSQDKYNQLFILTHNLYLFYEIRGNIDSIERKLIETTKEKETPIERIFNTYRVKKDSDDSSTVLICDKNEVLTDYDVYWSIVKDCKENNGYKALLPNAMRNILEYYFGFIKNEDDLNIALDNVVDKKFVRFIQRNSHSDKENFTYNIEEIDVNSFLTCFEDIFKKTKQYNHYKLKMMN